MDGDIIKKSYGPCPVCLKPVRAEWVRLGREVLLRKRCDAHGFFQAILWRGCTDWDGWTAGVDEIPLEQYRCADCSGLCPDHLQNTCCVLLEVTRRCDLECRFCFANGGGSEEPSFETIRGYLVRLARSGATLVQLSGGEPTVRDDLPEIVAAAKEAGCTHVQLNTNGVRLARDKGFMRALADAGLSFVFMQFDGVTDAVYEQLRGVPLLRIKQDAIEHCNECRIGVTLVPTLVRDVNTHQIGDIITFAVSRSPVVRGVHFQPASFLGRIPAIPTDRMRVTLDELFSEIERQTDGLIMKAHLSPSHCNHPLCGFHGDFVVSRDHGLVALAKQEKDRPKCCGTAVTARQKRAFVVKRWQMPPETDDGSHAGDLHDMESFLKRVKSHGFTVSAMAFQDAGNLDYERLRRCSLHVFDRGRYIPFCAYYLTGWKQQ